MYVCESFRKWCCLFSAQSHSNRRIWEQSNWRFCTKMHPRFLWLWDVFQLRTILFRSLQDIQRNDFPNQINHVVADSRFRWLELCGAGNNVDDRCRFKANQNNVAWISKVRLVWGLGFEHNFWKLWFLWFQFNVRSIRLETSIQCWCDNQIDGNSIERMNIQSVIENDWFWFYPSNHRGIVDFHQDCCGIEESSTWIIFL